MTNSVVTTRDNTCYVINGSYSVLIHTEVLEVSLNNGMVGREMGDCWLRTWKVTLALLRPSDFWPTSAVCRN